MMDVFHTLPYQQNKGELMQLCSTPLSLLVRYGDGWSRKAQTFFHKNKSTQKQPKVQTPSGIPVFGTVGVLLGSTAGVPFFWYCGGTAGEYCRSTFFGTVGVLLVSTAGVPFFLCCGAIAGAYCRSTFVWYCGGTVGSIAGVQFLVLVLCDGLSTAGTACLYWALYWSGTVLCIGPQHNLEQPTNFVVKQHLPWGAPVPFFLFF